VDYVAAVHLQNLFQQYYDALTKDAMYCTVGKLVAFDTDHAVYGASTLPGQSGSPVVSSAALLWRSAEGSEIQFILKLTERASSISKSKTAYLQAKNKVGEGQV
jgi:V8-like Glu-specific endopeptidase